MKLEPDFNIHIEEPKVMSGVKLKHIEQVRSRSIVKCRSWNLYEILLEKTVSMLFYVYNMFDMKRGFWQKSSFTE